MQMLRTLAPYASGSVGRVLRGLPVTAPLVRRVFTRSDETRAMMRTTQAVTILEAGHAANALPEHAEAMVNLRVSVDSTVDAALAHVRRAIGDDAVHVELVSRGEPAPISPTSGQGWRTVTATIATTFPEAVITPYVQTGATDSRFFTELSPAVYRFTPFVLDRAERDTLHAKNERIRVRSWLTGIEFYRDVLLRV
jgi:carboxypeptidase PM20D1